MCQPPVNQAVLGKQTQLLISFTHEQFPLKREETVSKQTVPKITDTTDLFKPSRPLLYNKCLTFAIKRLPGLRYTTVA